MFGARVRCRLSPQPKSTAYQHTRVTVQATAGSENASRRRSQRLNQQGRAPRQRTADLQRQLLEKEARQAEVRQLQQQLQADGALIAPAPGAEEEASSTKILETENKPREAAAPVDEQATKAQAAEAEADAAAAAALEEQLLEDAQQRGAAAVLPQVVVPDYVLEQRGWQQPARPRQVQSEVSRQAEALLAIMQAGERVEEVIAQYRADIDATMLQLLSRRMKAAEQVEKSAEVLEGLQLLYRRLKAEVDRQTAPAELRLLDEVMSILDPGEGDSRSPNLAREERRRQAAARLRAAFTGDLAGGMDVLSLAAQLGSGGGSQLADELVADPVDPMSFMAQATELLSGVQEQTSQLQEYVEQQREALAGRDADRGGEGEGQAALRGLLELEQALEQRQAAAALVQEALELAQAVMQKR